MMLRGGSKWIAADLDRIQKVYRVFLTNQIVLTRNLENQGPPELLLYF